MMRAIRIVAGLAAVWIIAAVLFGPIDSGAPVPAAAPPRPTEANRPSMPAAGWPSACLDGTAVSMAEAMKPRPDPRDTVECRRAIASTPAR